MFFSDRKHAGEKLAEVLTKFTKDKETIVLGLARGGVVVAAALAEKLELPLSVLLVHKVGAPHNQELAIGAVTELGEGFFNEQLIAMLDVPKHYVEQEVARQVLIAKQRKERYFLHKTPPSLEGKTILLVDDGIATGASMRAAIQALKKAKVKKIVLAVPVASPATLRQIEKEVDEAVCLYAPNDFYAVGQFYQNFDQTTDAQIIEILSACSY
jgi:putative phosphoribosyl transferase